MIVVVDASAAVKLVLEEPGSTVARRLWDEPVRWVAPSIVVPEVAAAVSAARRDGRLRATAARRVRSAWAQVIEQIDLLAIDASLADRAGELAASRPIRGMDAVYLAAAVALVGADPVCLLSFDGRQRDAVQADDGIALVPADLREH